MAQSCLPDRKARANSIMACCAEARLYRLHMGRHGMSLQSMVKVLILRSHSTNRRQIRHFEGGSVHDACAYLK